MIGNKSSLNLRQVFAFGGAFIAFMIGSGFATGQEVLQYFASYGYKGILGALVCFGLLLYVGVCYMRVGYEQKFEKSSMIFTYYCGEKVGLFFDWFTTLSIYLCFSVMLAGAGATVNQHFALPPATGAVLIGILACITVMFGLGKIVDVIGKIGPLIIVLALFLGAAALFTGFDNLKTVEQLIPTLDLMTASSNWLLSAASYVGISIVWLASFMTALGSSADGRREAFWGAAFGAMAFCAAIVVVTLGLMANLDVVAGSMIPSLVLATRIHPVLGTVFSVVIVAGIYTTAVPLLWTVCARLAPEKSTSFKKVAAGLTVLGLVIGLAFPFSKLVNVVYVLIGYVGFFILIFMVIKHIRQTIAVKR